MDDGSDDLVAGEVPEDDDDAWEGAGAQRGPRPANEGVRIIGAEEAAAAIETGRATPRRPVEERRFGDVPEPPRGPRPDLRFPGDDPEQVRKPPVAKTPPRRPPRRPPPSDLDRSFWDEEGPGPGSGPVARQDPDGEGTGPLPHWTEPPSGEVPRFVDDPEDDLATDWASLADGPRWRDQPTDWEDADFGASMLEGSDHRIGALGPEDDEAPFAFDEPEFSPAPVEPAEDLEAADDELGLAAPVRGRRAAGTRRAPSAAGIGGGRRGGGSRAPAPQPPVPAPANGGARGGDLSARIVTGALAGGVVLLAAGIGPGALLVLLTLVVTMASAELYQALRARGHHPATLLGLVATVAIMVGVYARGLAAMPLVLALVVVFSFLWYMAGVARVRPTMNVAVTILPFAYVGFLGSFSALLLKFPRNHGIGLLIGAVLATVAYDAGAYFVGRWVGRTPLAPAISPNKTMEGAIGGSVVALVVSLVVVGAIAPWTTGGAFWLAVVVAVGAPLGDLTESMIKRDLGIKDMGALLPGHGGVLDRIDALLYVIPATYYLARVLELF